MMEVNVSASRLGDLLGTLAHPHRLQLVMALAEGPRDAGQLMAAVGISQMGVVEHLRVLRAHHVVRDRRDNGRAIYELTWPNVVDWLGIGLAFIEGQLSPTPGRLVELPKSGQAS